MFIVSVHILKDDGYQRPGLDTLCQELNIKRNIHSALEDACILKTFFIKKPELLDHPYGYTSKDIVSHLNGKLPVSIQRLFDLALTCSPYEELQSILFEYVKRKTALNMNQLCKIAYWLTAIYIVNEVLLCNIYNENIYIYIYIYNMFFLHAP